ncbi:EF-hand domain-containing protein [Rhizobium sp. CC1099]|uniref:EF-hand domain-containing protein n=1 Tax=Rhizobium sp. CC1099 TaxID=3039160 RepID=UPI0024B09137|nr:EF-hand domain-containing protein [Rhizobium sp. CC1099]WFU88707.1 EF-hand domain-containing protein [Rhizobium sp. CC1099]
MKSARVTQVCILTAFLASGSATTVFAQMQGQTQQPPQTGMTPGGMMGGMPMTPGMMPGMCGNMMPGVTMNGMQAMPGMMAGGATGGMPMGGQMMKIMFTVADSDGDGALSFQEVTTIHKRIFDRVDANKDGKVTPDEIRTFMQVQ